MKVAILIDGGHLRANSKQADLKYSPDLIEKVAHSCLQDPDESLLRILYYDCAPFSGKLKQPVSGTIKQVVGSDAWLDQLARKDLFAVRRGVLKFRGFKPKRTPIDPDELTDDDFKPIFEQKGVDMRIGLDLALFSGTGAVQRVILITGDTDYIPALKHARKAGLQIVVIRLPGRAIPKELLWHCDFQRSINWPHGFSEGPPRLIPVIP